MALLIVTVIFLSLASLIGSGVLFTHQRLLTFLAASLTLLQGQWLLLTLIDQLAFSGRQIEMVLLAGSVLLLAAWSFFLKYWRWPYHTIGSGRRDVAVVVVLTLVALATVAVQSRNGFADGRYYLRGFYAGDTTTFVSLIQRAIILPERSPANPFAAGGELEYPTLLHEGFAHLFRLTGAGIDWLQFLPLLVYVQLLAFVPLFFLVMDIFMPEPASRERWLGFRSHWPLHGLQVAVILGLLTLSWDNYIFPQTHFFVVSLYLLCSALLLNTSKTFTFAPAIFSALALVVILLLSNAVMGTAALAAALVWLGVYFIRPGTKPSHRLALVLTSLALLALFLLATPGSAQLGVPHFSYSAVADFTRIAPFIILLLIGVALPANRTPYLSVVVVALCLLSMIVFFFSTRPLVVANASRFMYHALLVGFPLTIRPLLAGWVWFRHEYIYSSRSLIESAAAWGVVVFLGTLFILPTVASVASAHDILMFSSPYVLERADQEIQWWIADHTAPDDIILTSPLEPWVVPYFTGRSLLRAGHNDNSETPFWLTRDDDTLKTMRAAFRGDKDAQAQLLSAADYLLLPAAQQSSWPLQGATKLFHNQTAAIYKLR